MLPLMARILFIMAFMTLVLRYPLTEGMLLREVIERAGEELTMRDHLADDGTLAELVRAGRFAQR